MNLTPLFNLLRTVKTALTGGEKLPCYILSHNPLVIAAYWSDFLLEKEAILAALPDTKNIHFLFQFGWHKETDEKIAQLQDHTEDILSENRRLKFTFLCNSEVELNKVCAAGLHGELIHQNAFIDERRYPIIPKAPKKFDAIYIARITPFKRHHLAREIESLKLIGSYKPQEKEHFTQIMEELKHADWTETVLARNIAKQCSQARTGLCLSGEEGAMFVSAEYLLCGLPVLSVPNKGGRHTLFDPECTLITEDTPEAVAAGVQALINRKLDPYFIRQRTLKLMEEHRTRFKELMERIYKEEGADQPFILDRKSNCIHKLGLRSSVPLRCRKNLLRR